MEDMNIISAEGEQETEKSALDIFLSLSNKPLAEQIEFEEDLLRVSFSLTPIGPSWPKHVTDDKKWGTTGEGDNKCG